MASVLATFRERLARNSGKGVVKPIPYPSVVERSSPSFSDLVTIYKTDEAARLAVDSVAYLIAGRGFYTSIDYSFPRDEEAKQVIDEFCRSVELDEKLLLTLRDLVAFGTCIWEVITPSELQNIKILPIDSRWEIHRTPEGRLTRVTQRRGGKVVEFKPSEVIIWTWNKVGGSPFGRGLLHSLAETVQYTVKYRDGATETRTLPSLHSIKMMARDDLRKSLHHNVQKAAWYIKVPDSQVSAYASIISKLEPGERIMTNRETQILEEKIDPRGHFDAHIAHIDNAYSAALQAPIPRLYWDPGKFSEASARVVSEMFFNSVVTALERKVKRIVENRLFTPLLIQSGFNPDSAKARLNWGIQKEPKTALQDIFKGVEIGVIQKDEARSMLRKWGYDLDESLIEELEKE